MSVLVAVTDNPEGRAALAAAPAEARLLGVDLLVMNLGLAPIDVPAADGVTISVLERRGRGDRDPVEAILDEVETRGVERIVIGIRKRTPVGKALLGSISQRLLLDSPVPVLAVHVA